MANRLYRSTKGQTTPARLRDTAPTPSVVADPADTRKIRLAAAVLAGAMLAWTALQWLGARWGWNPRFAFLIDFAAIAAIVWSLIVTWQTWRRRAA